MNVWKALKLIYRTEGVKRGLFKGVSLTWFKAPIAITIAFNVNDGMRAQISQVMNGDRSQ